MTTDNSSESQGDSSSSPRLSPQKLASALGMFTGSEVFYRYWAGLARLTEGVKYLADQAQCYWLLDAIGSHQPSIDKHPDGRLRYMQFWKLLVNPDKSAVLTCVPDADEPPVVEQRIPFTDFPLEQIDIWIGTEGKDRVAMLPSEY